MIVCSLKQERESTMLKIRVKKIESVVNDCRVNKIELSPSNNFELPQNIIDNAIELLYHSINQWCGVKLSKIKSSLSTYKNYFNKGKKWWDNRKKIMLGYIFWLPVFKHIDQVITTCFQMFSVFSDIKLDIFIFHTVCQL